MKNFASQYNGNPYARLIELAKIAKKPEILGKMSTEIEEAVTIVINEITIAQRTVPAVTTFSTDVDNNVSTLISSQSP